jgi:uncharacterized protein
MHIDYPYRFDQRGRTGTTDDEDHVHDLVEQVLFTAPGERVNRPDFGSGLLQLVFAPNSDELATATQLMVQAALLRWLGEYISIERVEVESQDGLLRVVVQYVIRRTQRRRTDQFVQRMSG